MSETTIKLPVRLIYVDNILSDTHQIVDVNGKRVSKRAIVTALNESDALRGGVEGLKAMVADIKTATFFFPNEPGGHLGTNADISFSRGEYRYHLSGDLPGTAETFAQAYAALKGQGEQNG